MHCQICNAENLVKFLSLGHQPPSDAFLKKEDLEQPEVTYPLDVYFCPSCTLVQLGYAVDPNILFRDYVYNSGNNNTLKVNFKELVETIVATYKLQKDDFAVDIGSNDGTLLSNYIPHGVKILGIDPSSSTSIAIENGIPTEVDFFNEEVAKRVAQKHGKAKIITATNVFAHVVDLDSFMRGVDALLGADGVFISESGYVVGMVEGMQYDSIYHEHLRYYSLTALTHLFKRYGMEIVHMEKITTHGGSIRVYAARTGGQPVQETVKTTLDEEEKNGYTTLAIYESFAQRVRETKRALLAIVNDLRQKNITIAGIGAAAKGNTLLNYCKLDTDMIEYLTDRSPLKIGLFSPGMHLPVFEDVKLVAEQPGAAILLSWNLADELMPKLRTAGYKGKFIIPNPVPRIV